MPLAHPITDIMRDEILRDDVDRQLYVLILSILSQ